MGLGNKLKEALHGDKDSSHYDIIDKTSNTPGSFPADEIPRTHKHGGTFDSTTHEPRTEKLAGKRSPEHVYGSSGRDTTDYDTLDHTAGRRDGATSGTHGNKLTKEKDNRHPYWGEADQTNQRWHESSNTGARDHHTTTHSAHPERQGIHNTVTGAGSPRHDDLSRTGHGATATATATKTATDPYESRLDPGRTTHGNTHGTTGTGVPTSNLAHRFYDADATRRDHKVNEYDAPTSSEGRGKAGIAGAGVGAAAAGYGASQLSDRHHRDDMREYDAPSSGAPLRRHSPPGAAGVGRGYNEPHDTSTQQTTGSSMLDPYNTHAGGTSGRDSGLPAGGVHDRDRASVGSGSEHGSGSRAAARSTMGDDHYGPGHSGAKVMHQCEHCGRDNDISKYFRKDAVYRMT